MMSGSGADFPPSLSLTVPAYNEQADLRRVMGLIVAGLEQRGLEFEIIIVENGSRDRTAAIADELAKSDSRIRVVHLDKPDYGAALRTGYLHASYPLIANFSVDIVDFDFLDRALQEIINHDIVLGSKAVDPQEDSRPWHRRVASSAFHLVTRLVLGLSVKDTHGIKLLRRATVQPLVKRCRMAKDVFDDELIARALKARLSVVEVPLHLTEIRPSRVGLFRRAARSSLHLLELRVRLWFGG